MCQRRTFRGRRRGSGVRDMAPPLLTNLGAKFSTTSFPHFKTFYANQPISLDNNLKHLILVTITCRVSTFPSFPCESRIGSQLEYFFKLLI